MSGILRIAFNLTVSSSSTHRSGVNGLENYPQHGRLSTTDHDRKQERPHTLSPPTFPTSRGTPQRVHPLSLSPSSIPASVSGAGAFRCTLPNPTLFSNGASFLRPTNLLPGTTLNTSDSDSDSSELPYDNAGTALACVPVPVPIPVPTTSLRRGSASASHSAHAAGWGLGGHVYTSPISLPLASACALTSASASIAANSASSCSVIATFFQGLSILSEALETGGRGNDDEGEGLDKGEPAP
jgi:hypothetical protein